MTDNTSQNLHVSVLPALDFVMPYAEAQLRGRDSFPEAEVFISSTDVYKDRAGEMLAEDAPVIDFAEERAAEKEFLESCRRHGRKGMILRCPNVIGTGMTGFPRELVNSIFRGTFYHIPDNKTILSAVHATDVGRAAAWLLLNEEKTAHGDVFNLTDGVEHTLTDFADALAARMDNRHISTLRTRFQRWMYRLIAGRRKFSEYTTTLTFSDNRLRALGFGDTADVCAYLRTHVYDENSL